MIFLKVSNVQWWLTEISRWVFEIRVLKCVLKCVVFVPLGLSRIFQERLNLMLPRYLTCVDVLHSLYAAIKSDCLNAFCELLQVAEPDD